MLTGRLPSQDCLSQLGELAQVKFKGSDLVAPSIARTLKLVSTLRYWANVGTILCTGELVNVDDCLG